MGILRSLHSLVAMMGVDPARTLQFLRGLPPYLRDLAALKRQQRTSFHPFPFGTPYPCLGDRFSASGSASGHYFHQDLLVARRIFAGRSERHVDVGSRVDGFVAHIAAFRPIEVIDIRPLTSSTPNIRFLQADFMKPVSDQLIDYCDSLSCLHALEHFGLGRYGDPVSYDGYLAGLDNLHRVLKQGGTLYFSVPIGPQRIEFNAHRVFSVDYLLQLFNGRFRIERFCYVDDQGDLHEDISLHERGARDNFGCRYGCGIFEMIKL